MCFLGVSHQRAPAPAQIYIHMLGIPRQHCHRHLGADAPKRGCDRRCHLSAHKCARRCREQSPQPRLAHLERASLHSDVDGTRGVAPGATQLTAP